MYGVVSVLLLTTALLLGQAAFAAVRMTPQPKWVSDNMQAYALVPYIVTATAGGIGGIVTWLFGGEWRTQSVLAWGVMAATIVGYLLARRGLKAWAAAHAPAQPLVAVGGG
ncbi:MAG: hypothetical protein LJE90_09880, partial [Betaproteobacteria bacterium]|nr:hypothetical protein [Betaproteobacteria bacterium]